METAQIQLVLNVVAITGVTSLASFCYMLKKENRKLAGLRAASKPAGQGSAVAPIQVACREKDNRTYAAGQRARWVDGMRLTTPGPDADSEVPKTS
jgi:hypothetical protein